VPLRDRLHPELHRERVPVLIESLKLI
jgi:hypothetical protein